MNERDSESIIDQNGLNDEKPQILRNELGQAVDPTVVIDEANRTILLTENETIVIEKEHLIDIAPKNRPRKVYGGMWGPIEIATAGSALLAVIAAILLYVFVVVPSNQEVLDNRAKMATLERELISSREKYGSIATTETQVAKLLSSVTDFESTYLPIAATGRTALYQKINGLIAGYGLVNTTGPDFAPLEIVDKSKGNQTEEEQGKSKFRSLFPGIYVSTTVEGPYQNLRRFIREIETGNEFVVISAVELEPSEAEQKTDQRTNPVQAGIPGGSYPANPTSGGFQDANTSMPVQTGQTALPNRNGGKTHGSTVRLRLEMAAYFRRPNAAPVDPEAVTQ